MDGSPTDPDGESQPAADAPTDPSARRTVVWLGGALVALIVVTIVITSLRDPATYEPGSPEAVVQTYFRAILDGDDKLALAQLTPELAEQCEDDIVERIGNDGVRVTLREADVDTDRARVEVRLRFSDTSDPFSGGGYDTTETILLEPVSGDWRITDEPWPIYFCGGSP